MKGANLFAKDNKGGRAIDIPVWTSCEEEAFMGEQLLDYAKDLKWQSVKQLLLLSASHHAHP
jgi:hypothetical protein